MEAAISVINEPDILEDDDNNRIVSTEDINKRVANYTEQYEDYEELDESGESTQESLVSSPVHETATDEYEEWTDEDELAYQQELGQGIESQDEVIEQTPIITQAEPSSYEEYEEWTEEDELAYQQELGAQGGNGEVEDSFEFNEEDEEEQSSNNPYVGQTTNNSYEEQYEEWTDEDEANYQQDSNNDYNEDNIGLDIGDDFDIDGFEEEPYEEEPYEEPETPVQQKVTPIQQSSQPVNKGNTQTSASARELELRRQIEELEQKEAQRKRELELEKQLAEKQRKALEDEKRMRELVRKREELKRAQTVQQSAPRKPINPQANIKPQVVSTTPQTQVRPMPNQMARPTTSQPVNRPVQQAPVQSIKQATGGVDKIARYSALDITGLWEEVRIFMENNGVRARALPEKLLTDEFGADNIKKLYKKGYIIPFAGKRVTFG